MGQSRGLILRVGGSRVGLKARLGSEGAEPNQFGVVIVKPFAATGGHWWQHFRQLVSTGHL